MSEPKFTPGPWFSVAKLSGSENHRGFKICGDDGWALADIQPVDEDGIEGRANANLIAAAPELYEALVKLRDYANDSDDYKFGTILTSLVFDIAEAALAKSRGEG